MINVSFKDLLELETPCWRKKVMEYVAIPHPISWPSEARFCFNYKSFLLCLSARDRVCIAVTTNMLTDLLYLVGAY